MTASLEVGLINRLLAGFPRSPAQLNQPHESDAELIGLADVRPDGGQVLAITTDSIVEEIDTGLYRDPWLIGWMAVVASASDLAAVGAEPLGILLCETLPRDAPPELLAALQRGIADASAAHHLPVLGGDTNHSDRLALNTTAIGIIAGGAPLTRRGIQPGDALFATGPFGLGSAFALAQLKSKGEVDYRPRARLAESALIRRWASACMDSSDGLIPTLHELGRLNGVGFSLTADTSGLLDERAWELALVSGLPPWTMLAGPHGEFELIFGIRPERVAGFLAEAAGSGWSPLRLGAATAGQWLTLRCHGDELVLDAGRVRNLFAECGGCVDLFAASLLPMAELASHALD